MEFAHQNGIMHGDLRPSNILFDNNNHPKISDLGFERHYLRNNAQQDWYQPDHRGEMSVKRDIYSAGVVFHQLLTGELPRISYTQFKPGKAFQNLESEVQEVVENMINLQSINRLQSFTDVRVKLYGLYKAERSKKAEGTGIRFGWSYFLLLILLVNLVAIIVLYLSSPGFSSWIANLLSGI
jgi:serine/threonine protein kinase